MNQQIPKIDFVKKIREIKKKKFVPALRIDNTGIGFTLETMLGIRENNYTKGDFIDTGIYNGILFELKSQRYQKHDPRTKKNKKKFTSNIFGNPGTTLGIDKQRTFKKIWLSR